MFKKAIGCMLIAFTSHCLADSWSRSYELVQKEFPFGDLTVTRSYDGREPLIQPSYWVDVSEDGILIARLSGVSFEASATSPDGKYFVGISNSGLPNSAYFVVDREGQLVAYQKHATAAIHYCDMTVSIVRKWYNPDQSPISFTTVDGGDYVVTTKITVAGCDGREIELLQW